MRPTRFAHLEGHTDITYNEDGSRIITCGLDGDIRVFENLDDDDCITYSVANKAHCIGFKDDSILVGTNLNLVQSYTLDEGKPNGIITRFTAYPTHINLSHDKTLIAVGGSDTVVKVHDSANFKDLIFNGHEAPILSVAIDPKRDFLASSSCDGTVRIWNFRTQTIVRCFNLLPKSNDFSFSNTLCRLCWSSDGEYLFVPVGLEVQVFNRVNWKVEYKLNHSSISETVSIAVISPCGKFLAGGCKDGRIAVWKLESRTCICSEKPEKSISITGLVWHPKDKEELAFVNISGEFGTMENFLQKSVPLSKGEIDSTKQMTEGNAEVDTGEELALPFDGDEDGEEDTEISIAKIKSQLGFADDEEGTFVGLPKSGEGNDSRPESRLDSVVGVPPPVPTVVAPKLPEPQKPFQPGMSPEFLNDRYMLWNNTGIVRQYRSEEEQSIEVEFHDSSVHHALHLNNHMGHSMAALNNEALALAAESQDDQLSKLVIHHFSSWDGSREWQTDMSEGEDILAIGIGLGWIAVATDLRNLRIFTTAGVQRDVLSLPGPIVCLAGFEKNVMVVCHNGMGVNGEQSLSVMILNVSGKRHLLPSPVPLSMSPKSFLAWAGFTDEGTPITVDSAGVVRLFNNTMGLNWTPVLNTRSHASGKSDHYFILGASELQNVVRCILCKGSRYPLVLPRPHVSLLEFKLPLCEPESEKSSLEEKVIRTKLVLKTIESLLKEGFDLEGSQSENNKLLKESMVKLFALALRADREARGLEVCELMPTPDMVEVGVRYAAKLHRIQLAERLNEVIVRKVEESSQVDEEEDVFHSLPNRNRVSEYDNLEESSSTSFNDFTNTDSENQESREEILKSNPLLKAAAHKQNLSKENPFDSLTPSPSMRNPFKKSSSSLGTPKGIHVLDTLKVTKKEGPPVLRPVMKFPKAKKGTPVVEKVGTLKSLNNVGKENKLDESTGKPNGDQMVSSSNDAVEQPNTPKEVTSESKGSTTKKISALKLWLDDNVDFVKEKYPGVAERELFVKAAMLFKDVEDSVKQKYKAMATDLSQKGKENAVAAESNDSEATNPSTNEDLSQDKKRKPESNNVPPAEKKLKMNTSSKLASFAFSKKTN